MPVAEARPGQGGTEVKNVKSSRQRMSLREANGVCVRWKPGDQRIRRDQMMRVHDKDEEQERESTGRLKLSILAATHYCKWTT